MTQKLKKSIKNPIPKPKCLYFELKLNTNHRNIRKKYWIDVKNTNTRDTRKKLQHSPKNFTLKALPETQKMFVEFIYFLNVFISSLDFEYGSEEKQLKKSVEQEKCDAFNDIKISKTVKFITKFSSNFVL